MRWGEQGTGYTTSYKHLSYDRCIQLPSISYPPLVGHVQGFCLADVVTMSELLAQPKWLLSVGVVVRSCMTLTVLISVNSSSLAFKLSDLD